MSKMITNKVEQRFFDMIMDLIPAKGEYVCKLGIGSNFMSFGIDAIQDRIIVSQIDIPTAKYLEYVESLNENGTLAVATGIYLYDIVDHSLVKKEYIKHYNRELVVNDAMTLTLFQCFGYQQKGEYSEKKLQELLAAEKIKKTLVYACYEDNRTAINEFLDKQKVSGLDKTITRVGTPLMFCAMNNNLEGFVKLLERGAKIEKKVAANDAVMVAISNDAKDIVKYLYDTKNPYFMDIVKKDGLVLAIQCKNREIMEILKACGDDMFHYDSGTPTIFMMLMYNNLEAVKFLVENGLDLQCKNKAGRSVMEVAQHCKNREIFDYLISVSQ